MYRPNVRSPFERSLPPYPLRHLKPEPGEDGGYARAVSFREALARGVLLGDGANGTLLAERGFKKQPYDLANLEAPELVRAAHQEYFDAGSDFVETNTFCSNHFKLDGFGVDSFFVTVHAMEGSRLNFPSSSRRGSTARVRNSSTSRPCERQLATAVSIRSTKRLPRSPSVP